MTDPQAWFEQRCTDSEHDLENPTGLYSEGSKLENLNADERSARILAEVYNMFPYKLPGERNQPEAIATWGRIMNAAQEVMDEKNIDGDNLDGLIVSLLENNPLTNPQWMEFHEIAYPILEGLVKKGYDPDHLVK